MKTFKLRIITPERTIFDGEVVSVTVPATNGSMGILHGHAPIVSSLETGEIKVLMPSARPLYFMASGGFLEVAGNEARILADVGEAASDIDESRAKEAESRARQRIKERAAKDVDLARAEAALARAVTRLRVARRYQMSQRERQSA